MSITIPSFVPAGLTTMEDATLADPTGVRYRTEAELRDAMAALWWLHGWTVRTEVKVPNCGRIDVLAQSADSSVIIELKKSITTPTQARMAFQQAHAYRAFMEAAEPMGKTHDDRRRFAAFVTAGDWNYDAVMTADIAFREVDFAGYVDLVEKAHRPEPWEVAITSDALAQAQRIARYRSAEIGALFSATRAAVNHVAMARERVAS